MAAATQDLADMSEKLRLACSYFQHVCGKVACLTAGGAGARPLSESVVRVNLAANLAIYEASKVLEAAEATKVAVAGAKAALAAAEREEKKAKATAAMAASKAKQAKEAASRATAVAVTTAQAADRATAVAAALGVGTTYVSPFLAASGVALEGEKRLLPECGCCACPVLEFI